MRPFVHLHCHTPYSFLDGATEVKTLVSRAAELGMPAVAVTDHNNVCAAVEVYRTALEMGVKPIQGVEATVTGGHHLTLLATGPTGYGNICRALTDGFVNSERLAPHMSKEAVFKHREGVIVLSGCEKGEIATLVRQGDYRMAARVAAEYKSRLLPDHFFIELVNPYLPYARTTNSMLKQIAEYLHVGVVATNNVHYCVKDGFHVHDLLTCIRTLTTLDDVDPERRLNAENYLKTHDEMAEAFYEYPEAISNALSIAERCEPAFRGMTRLFPKFDVPEGTTAHQMLRDLTYQGAASRYGKITEEVTQRLESELHIIHTLGFDDYFLSMWDIVRYAREKGVRYVGRGSAADSAVAYCLFITSVDSIKRGLLFERFLSLERRQTPDIDVDFDARYRDDIIEYVYDKYGAEHAAMVCTYNTFRARSAIRDVAKAFGFPKQEIDWLAKRFPHIRADAIEEALDRYPEIRQSNIPIERYLQLFEVCRAIDGFPRFISTHLGGVVVCGEPLVNITPLQKSAKGVTIVQFDKDYVEELGLIKLDLLSLRTLAAVEDSIHLIHETSPEFRYEEIPYDDKPTFEMLNTGETIGVFQLESPAQKALQGRLGAENIEDIVASVALIRPGPIEGNMVEPFINRRRGEEKIEFIHPKLKPILEKTYGVVLYQEQVIQIATAVAGFMPGEADRLRKAMTHKRSRKDMEDIGKEFIERSVANGIGRDVAELIFSYIQGYAGYGFCEAHSAAFADTAYKTAYLVRHYPAEFYAAILSNQPMGYYSPATIALEARRRGITILGPDVNRSQERFSVEDGAIRVSLSRVRGMTEAARNSILEARKTRPFSSLEDFCLRAEVDMEIAENLILCGAFDSIFPNRRQLLWDLYEVMPRCQKVKERMREAMASGVRYMDLLPEESGVRVARAYTSVQDFSLMDRFKQEMSVLGLSPSGHFMYFYRQQLTAQRILSTKEARECPDDRMVRVAGVVVRPHRPPTRSGKTVVFLSLEDEFGMLDVTIFEDRYKRYGGLIFGEPALIIGGRIQRRGQTPSLIADSIAALPRRMAAK